MKRYVAITIVTQEKLEEFHAVDYVDWFHLLGRVISAGDGCSCGSRIKTEFVANDDEVEACNIGSGLKKNKWRKEWLTEEDEYNYS
ncbi:hypothetical protein PoB_002722400 [Plakobranchus ocellatus]|uniref:Uncharacterized protein n=1 Tax=Plakobranchus ocellatus TaxID=259542 RepID=A0AAV4A3F1_9GAST|nr:hypothetical protein PoB_002722400 [Plakobranchus ocellatus]